MILYDDQIHNHSRGAARPDLQYDTATCHAITLTPLCCQLSADHENSFTSVSSTAAEIIAHAGLICLDLGNPDSRDGHAHTG